MKGIRGEEERGKKGKAGEWKGKGRGLGKGERAK